MISEDEINKRQNLVNNIVYTSILDQGIEDLENVNFTERTISESFVFNQVTYFFLTIKKI